MEALLS